MNYLIAIPVFNEIKYVEQVLSQVRQFHDRIVFIDDGSTDGTAEWLARRSDVQLVRHDRNRGYGRSIIDSFDYAHRQGFDWVITMDCDEQHEPKMIPRFVEKMKKNRWDVISGSRYMAASARRDVAPGDRRAINMTITSTLNELFHFGITDAFCGFKAHRVDAMQALKLDETGYAFPLQLWPRMAATKLRVTEIAVPLIYNDPNRYFGGGLDDAERRLQHYRDVLKREMNWTPVAEPAKARDPVSASARVLEHICQTSFCCGGNGA